MNNGVEYLMKNYKKLIKFVDNKELHFLVLELKKDCQIEVLDQDDKGGLISV